MPSYNREPIEDTRAPSAARGRLVARLITALSECAPTLIAPTDPGSIPATAGHVLRHLQAHGYTVVDPNGAQVPLDPRARD